MHKSQPIVFMFSGQGSQYYQMGINLYQNNSTFKYWVNIGCEIVKNKTDIDLLDILYQDRPSKFDPPFKKTIYTHPAIFIIEYSLAMILIENGIHPDITLGYSIGEYCANAVAGTISFEDGINMLVKQAQLVEAHTEPATMMAILAPVSIYEDHKPLFSETEVAGINYDTHFVISGKLDRLNQIHQYLKENSYISQILPISHGFHSSLMDSIEESYKKFCNSINIDPIQVPIISPTTRDYLSDLNWTDYFWDVTRKPAQFKDVINMMESTNNYRYIDLGPAGTLATFVKYNLKDSQSETFITMNQFGTDLKNIEKIISL